MGSVLVGALVFRVPQARGEDAPLPPCTGKHQGQTLSPDDVKKVLDNHREWAIDAELGMVNPDAPDERLANLCGANLMMTDSEHLLVIRVPRSSLRLLAAS